VIETAMTTTTDDPIRTEVERVLTTIAGAALAAPFAIVTFVPRCVLRQAAAVRRRFTEPARVARSLLDLVGSSAAMDRAAESRPAPPDREPRLPRAVADHLPIDEYESLAASQVVDRLSTLTDDELAAVRAFEATHRGRRTILGRIDQLLD
jgi:hypothetical protein